LPGPFEGRALYASERALANPPSRQIFNGREESVMKEFKCKDAGHACDWKYQSNDEKDIIENAKNHGRQQHGLKDVKDDQVKPLIHDVA
jgi:predicted small metal-binding protein